MFSSMRAFMRGVVGLPRRVQLWLVILSGLNMVGPLPFIGHPEARVVLGTFLLAFALMSVLTRAFGFTRVLGLGHIVWLALVPYLWMRLDHIPAGDIFGLWVRAVVLANTVSLAFDIVDVARYVRGEREAVVDLG